MTQNPTGFVAGKPDLRNVTAVVFDHRQPKAAVKLLAAMADVVELGDIKYLNHFDGWKAFNYWENFEAWKFIRTDFALFMHLDGYVVRPDLWDPQFLAFDYIGAPWPSWLNKDRVGNGGFCIKSRKLMLHMATLPWVDLPGDVTLCSHYRTHLLAKGFKFAPVDVAARFSTEHDCPETPAASFGFHGIFGTDKRKNQFSAWTAERSAL
ncbi:MAG TPA: DUF5672 family protein [Opitutaceae bacterium]|nr:DUF5672 family protein [Opitutaceae bacterium]